MRGHEKKLRRSWEEAGTVWEEYEKMQELASSEELFGRPSSGLFKARLSQIEGGRGVEVIQQLQKIRTACIDDSVSFVVPREVDPAGRRSFPLPEAIQVVNRRATGDTLYWTGICQMDRGQPGTAISTFQNYRRQYSEGIWYFPSLMNQAISEMAHGRTAAANATLREACYPENPERSRAERLLERIGAAAPEE